MMECPPNPPPYELPPTPLVMTNQTTMVVIPPPAYKDYMAHSILNIFFCCLPLGIVALVFSIKTRNHINHTRAEVHSRSAHSWNKAASAVGFCIYAAWISFFIYTRVAYTSYYYG